MRDPSTCFPWAKGHGTENDFVLLPDPDGSVHGRFDAPEDIEFVAAVCHRHRGLGADGVIRVVRSAALAQAHDVVEAERAVADGAEWFMDYRNADGSTSEMCGNGVRVLAQWLVEERLVDEGLVDDERLVDEGLVDEGLVDEGLVDVDEGSLRQGAADGTRTFGLGSRAGTVLVTPEGAGRFSVDMGPVGPLPGSEVAVGDRRWLALGVETGNPHAVVRVEHLADAGALTEPPVHDRSVYPDGVNVEFVALVADRHVRIRVHERGSGETRSCGTGACAAAVLAERLAGQPARPATYRVDVPGGRLEVTLRPDGHAVLAGPAEVVARGTMTWTAANPGDPCGPAWDHRRASPRTPAEHRSFPRR